jgi:hemerythrin-like domain-containing protein
MDALQLLIKDHRAVEETFEKIGKAGTTAEKTRERLFEKLRQELELRTQIEEKIFYTEMKRHAATKGLIGEALEEHAEVKQMLLEIRKLSPRSDEWSDRILELKEAGQHHVDEEESKIFPAARNALDEDRLEELGRRMQQMKKEKAAA